MPGNRRFIVSFQFKAFLFMTDGTLQKVLSVDKHPSLEGSCCRKASAEMSHPEPILPGPSLGEVTVGACLRGLVTKHGD